MCLFLTALITIPFPSHPISPPPSMPPQIHLGTLRSAHAPPHPPSHTQHTHVSDVIQNAHYWRHKGILISVCNTSGLSKLKIQWLSDKFLVQQIIKSYMGMRPLWVPAPHEQLIGHLPHQMDQGHKYQKGRNSWQQMNHAWLCSDWLLALKKIAFSYLIQTHKRFKRMLIKYDKTTSKSSG